jgi:hypothetical protein
MRGPLALIHTHCLAFPIAGHAGQPHIHAISAIWAAKE